MFVYYRCLLCRAVIVRLLVFGGLLFGLGLVTLLGESMTAMQVIGGALILGFTLLNELSPVPKAKKE